MTYAQAAIGVADEIRMIMAEYRKQEAEGSVDTPGGLEHMGDVWKQLDEWDRWLTEAADEEITP
jgi:hypothetical protein